MQDLGTVVREIQQERIENEDLRQLEAKILESIKTDA